MLEQRLRVIGTLICPTARLESADGWYLAVWWSIFSLNGKYKLLSWKWK